MQTAGFTRLGLVTPYEFTWERARLLVKADSLLLYRITFNIEMQNDPLIASFGSEGLETLFCEVAVSEAWQSIRQIAGL